jgi:hypothetical protein
LFKGLVGQTREGNHWEMGSKFELKNIESIVGDVLSENKGKVSIVFQQIINFGMTTEKERTTHYTKRT